MSPPPVGTPVSERSTLKMVPLWHGWMLLLEQTVNALQTQLDFIERVTLSWTPHLVGTSGGSAHTYVTQWGGAVRSGTFYTVAATLELAALDPTMGGTVSVTGLPAELRASFGPPEAFLPMIVAFSNINLGGNFTSVFGALRGGDDKPLLYQQGRATGWELLPAATLTAATQLAVSGSYWST